MTIANVKSKSTTVSNSDLVTLRFVLNHKLHLTTGKNFLFMVCEVEAECEAAEVKMQDPLEMRIAVEEECVGLLEILAVMSLGSFFMHASYCYNV